MRKVRRHLRNNVKKMNKGREIIPSKWKFIWTLPLLRSLRLRYAHADFAFSCLLAFVFLRFQKLLVRSVTVRSTHRWSRMKRKANKEQSNVVCNEEVFRVESGGKKRKIAEDRKLVAALRNANTWPDFSFSLRVYVWEVTRTSSQSFFLFSFSTLSTSS